MESSRAREVDLARGRTLDLDVLLVVLRVLVLLVVPPIQLLLAWDHDAEVIFSLVSLDPPVMLGHGSGD